MMKTNLLVVRNFLLQVLTLFVLARLLGNPIMYAGVFLSSPAACIGYRMDFRFMIGACIASIMMAAFLYWKSVRPVTILTFGVALAVVDAFFAGHMKVAFCS